MPIKSRHIFLSHASADVVRHYTKALKRYFSEEPAGEPIELDVGKLDEQLPHILAALGQRAPDYDLATAQEVVNKSITELLLELTEPTLTRDESGKEILSARAKIH